MRLYFLCIFLNPFGATGVIPSHKFYPHPLVSFSLSILLILRLFLFFHSLLGHFPLLRNMFESFGALLDLLRVNCSFLKCSFIWLLQHNLYITHTLSLQTDTHTSKHSCIIDLWRLSNIHILVCKTCARHYDSFLSPTPTYSQLSWLINFASYVFV